MEDGGRAGGLERRLGGRGGVGEFGRGVGCWVAGVMFLASGSSGKRKRGILVNTHFMARNHVESVGLVGSSGCVARHPDRHDGHIHPGSIARQLP